MTNCHRQMWTTKGKIKMRKDEFDAWERERIEWVMRTFANAVEVRMVDGRTVECRCVLHDSQGEREANNVAYLLATDVSRIMNGGSTFGGPWYIYEEPVYYDRDGHCFEPETDADFDRVGAVEYVIDKED